MLKPAFQAACRAAIEALARETAAGGPALLVGTPWLDGGKLYNAVALLDGGAIAALRYKVDLPNYGVFDEKRVFAAGPMPGPVNFRGVRLGLPICEDIWGEEMVECLAETGAEIAGGAERLALLAAEGRRAAQHRGARASPSRGCRWSTSTRSAARTNWCSTASRSACMPIARWRFSLRRSRKRSSRRNGQRQRRDLALRQRADGRRASKPSAPTMRPACWACATTSTRTDFPASSSGCRAASTPRSARPWRSMRSGAERVRCMMMPYKYTAQESLDDAAACAKALGVHYEIMPIAPAVEGLEAALAPRLRRLAARRHRRKSAGACARHHPDGDLQQVQCHGGDHRQQVGNVGRLRHALWRHERRLQSDQGSLQDRSVPAGAPAQRLEAGRRAGTGRRA